MDDGASFGFVIGQVSAPDTVLTTVAALSRNAVHPKNNFSSNIPPDRTNGQINALVEPENNHHRGEYHCMADPLFNWFGFDQTSKAVSISTYAKQLNPNKINKRSAIQ